MLQSILCVATATALCIASSVSAHAEQRLLMPGNANAPQKLTTKPNDGPSNILNKPNTRISPDTSKPTLRAPTTEVYTATHDTPRPTSTGWFSQPPQDKQAAKIAADRAANVRKTNDYSHSNNYQPMQMESFRVKEAIRASNVATGKGRNSRYASTGDRPTPSFVPCSFNPRYNCNPYLQPQSSDRAPQSRGNSVNSNSAMDRLQGM